MVQKERLEEERDEGCEEIRMIETEKELEDIVMESDSITQTLDTLEEHLTYVTAKISKISDEIRAWDPESIKPPRFKGLNSVDSARQTLKVFFMVLLDLNVYKKDLETKCIEQDETILELQGTLNILQERLGLTQQQKDAVREKQRMINQMVGRMGDNTEFID